MEAEADYLASVLLVLEQAVMYFARNGVSIETAAKKMGVSTQMMRWRFNGEGAHKRIKRGRNY